MKKHFMIISILSGFLCLLISFSIQITSADKSNQPPVVRKKTDIPDKKANVVAGDRQISTLKPKSDIIRIIEKSTTNQVSLNIAKNQTLGVPLYDPTGKIDPFQPLYRQPPKVKRQDPEYTITNQGPLTELEKLDLSQIQLTGVILAKSGNKGLVREASGKGHIISVGTRIGRHGGSVASIYLNRVIIAHKMVDELGKEFVQKKELKVRKEVKDHSFNFLY